jgi:hypothetical protein
VDFGQFHRRIVSGHPSDQAILRSGFCVALLSFVSDSQSRQTVVPIKLFFYETILRIRLSLSNDRSNHNVPMSHVVDPFTPIAYNQVPV